MTRATRQPAWTHAELKVQVRGELRRSETSRRKPKLLERMSQALRSRHYNRWTTQAYYRWLKRFIFFHKVRHPVEMGGAEANAFLTHLALKEKVSASMQNQALSALLFLYRHVLGREIGDLGEVIRAWKPKRLPVVMNRDEVKAIHERGLAVGWGRVLLPGALDCVLNRGGKGVRSPVGDL
ncbi:MAG: phage integrase N-terminal SAM-like domain-containing protein [Verrucomicrobia bacterium]|nr:phage integrase N-terminal SAM-like domain-containing protein [Verrucomicrobiota bacterium]